MPKDFVASHTYVTMAAEMMFVKRNSFLITVSRGINLITVVHTRGVASQVGGPFPIDRCV